MLLQSGGGGVVNVAGDESSDDLVDALLQDAENGAAFLAKLKWISLKLYNWNMS